MFVTIPTRLGRESHSNPYSFIHALLGGDHLSGSALGYSASQDSFAGAFGGGVDWKVAGSWSVWVSADYVFSRHNIFGVPSYTQNNYRGGVGIAYRFGGRSHERAASRPSERENSPAHSVGVPIPQLGITAGSRDEGGAEILVIDRGGIAELANLRVGEVITELDSKPVNSPMELAAELQQRPAGWQAHLTYIFRTSAMGWVSNETVVTLR